MNVLPEQGGKGNAEFVARVLNCFEKLAGMAGDLSDDIGMLERLTVQS